MKRRKRRTVYKGKQRAIGQCYGASRAEMEAEEVQRSEKDNPDVAQPGLCKGYWPSLDDRRKGLANEPAARPTKRGSAI